MIVIEDKGKAVGDAEIVAIENAINVHLPESYRRFILVNNGGVPSPDIIDIEGLPGSPTDIQIFFGINREIVSSNLLWNWETFLERIHDKTLLPVACDSGGNLFCLTLLGEEIGKIVYCDLQDHNLILHPVAPNFETFLEKIRPWK
jgi:hypothetical protein